MKKTFRDLPVWTPFQQSSLIPITPAEREARIDHALTVFPTLTRADIERQLDAVNDDTVFVNSRYQVNGRMLIGTPFGNIVHLSIKRLDKDRVGKERYRDFQRIKNELTNPEFQAVEIYPAHSDEIDTANQYHLWVFITPGYKLPFGWIGQRAVDGRSPLGGRQHPLEE